MRCLLFLYLLSAQVFAVGFANGLKIGEVRSTSATVWTRLTEEAKQEKFDKINGGAVPGAVGFITIVVWKDGVTDKPHSKNLRHVTEGDDFTFQYQLEKLEPQTKYLIEVEGRKDLSDVPVILRGEFRTAPAATEDKPVKFMVSTCQCFREMDDLENGHQIYKSMAGVGADFFVQTGDAVYFDRPPLAKNITAARFKWNRMYALPNFREFHRKVPSYWLKDDHDMLKDDCWPGQKYGDLTWEQGLKVWHEQLPMSAKPYRTFRWGKHLQVWLVEGREFRTPNKIRDGAEKTILGKEQWEWLRKSMEESDATYRIYISATPVVGPDRKNKNDNHANAGFTHEGDKLRKFLSSQPGCFVICGDRHWQYHSTDPKTALKEFGCGPATDEHAQGFREKDRVPWQSYFRPKGGFLSVAIGSGVNPEAKIMHHDVQGKVVNEIIIKR